MRSLPLFGLVGSTMLLAFTATPQAADPSPPAAAQHGGGAQIPANGGWITLEVNKGTLVRLSGPAATVFVANPDIADVQVKSPTLVYISAKAPGETVIYAVDATDAVLLNATILVEHDVSWLRSSLRQLAPGEHISADSVDGNLVLSGVV
jgi:pilus assembly protein CpaC